MADALLSPAAGTAMCVVSAAANIYSAAKIKKDDLCEKKIPVMGVMGAFIFAAQMINFTIPATGSSGHIGGGILLAAMIGSYPALLSISSVLLIQCLFFADGGLLALGCNIFNLGLIPCLILYPLLFKPILKKKMTSKNITIASIAAVIISLQLGALAVVLETQVSGITELPFLTFISFMQPIHLAIGLVEGIVTAAILCFVYQMRPEIMDSTYHGTAVKSSVPVRNLLIVLTAAALITGGVLSLTASSKPDGLEWSMQKTAGTAELQTEDSLFDAAARIQETTAWMPDYAFQEGSRADAAAGTSAAGIIGGLLTFLLAGVAAFSISAYKKRQKKRNRGF